MGQAVVTRLDGPAVETEIAWDMLRRGAWAAPVVMAAGGALWGLDGALSAGYAMLVVALNFVLAASMLAWTARISLGLMMGTALFGYLIRLGLIFLAVMLVKDAAWVELVPLGLTLILTHLGLLFWEMRHVSASLAHPGLKPDMKES
jgi:hypothetical protein